MKNQKGVTMVALTITVILFAIILATITFSSLSSVHVKRLNNMYADVMAIQDRVDDFYAANGALPVYDSTAANYAEVLEPEIQKFTAKMIVLSQEASSSFRNLLINPNDEISATGYYMINLDLLGTLNLSNAKKTDNVDYYFVNKKSHQVYYGRGVVASEDATDIRYSIPFDEYENVDSKISTAQSTPN